MANKVYGIDLGTTYSCIAHVDEHGKPAVIPNSDNELTTPSVVYFESSENIVVGSAAKDVSEVYPDQVVSTVKREMGNPEAGVEMLERVAQMIGENGIIEKKPQLDGRFVNMYILPPKEKKKH